MAKMTDIDLSRRERQIMTLLYRKGEASPAEIAKEMSDPLSDTAIRTFLRILEKKGYVKRQKDGRRFLYRPAVHKNRAAKAALENVLQTFFGGSLGDAVAAHLADPSSQPDKEELKRLTDLLKDAKKGGRR